MDLVLKPALDSGLDLDPQVVLNSILDGCGQVRNPAAWIGRDVLHKHREGPKGRQGASREIERSMDRCPNAIECGLHALVQKADRGCQRGPKKIECGLNRGL